ncbi:hypothetical protein C0J52_18912, partial [Blattella germanica]
NPALLTIYEYVPLVTYSRHYKDKNTIDLFGETAMLNVQRDLYTVPEEPLMFSYSLAETATSAAANGVPGPSEVTTALVPGP